jgi:hypothetical protein
LVLRALWHPGNPAGPKSSGTSIKKPLSYFKKIFFINS